MKSLLNVRLFMVMSLFFYAGNAVAMDADTAGQALSNAARLSNLEDVQALIAVGANVNWRDNFDTTPLMIAVMNGRLNIVQALISAGADLNIPNRLGLTALMIAISCSNLNIIQALIAAGADLNIRYNRGDTALIDAVSSGHLDIVQALLVAGADVNARNNIGGTASIRAVKMGRLDMINLIINADDFDASQLLPIIDYLLAKENKTAVEEQILSLLEERFWGSGLK